MTSTLFVPILQYSLYLNLSLKLSHTLEALICSLYINLSKFEFDFFLEFKGVRFQASHTSRKPEVTDFNMTVFIDQNVGRFDVSM